MIPDTFIEDAVLLLACLAVWLLPMVVAAAIVERNNRRR